MTTENLTLFPLPSMHETGPDITELAIGEFFTNSRAYFIAINDYENPVVTCLTTPKDDVLAVKEVLVQQHGFSVEPVEYISGHGQKIVLPNPLINPNAQQVKDFLTNIRVTESERVIVYFAGHGIASISDNEREGYLLAADANPPQWDTYIKMKDVWDWLHRLSCKHFLLILDCCYAGSFRWANRSRSLGVEVPKTIFYERFTQYAKNKAWQLITSSAHDQKAIDTLGLGKRERDNGHTAHSPFTAILLRALKHGEADLSYGSIPCDGIITVSELGFFLRQEICRELFEKGIEINEQQLTGISPLTPDTKGEFLFISPGAVRTPAGKIALKNKTNQNPYKGLYAYQVKDNKIFYGRQRVLEGWTEGNTSFEGLINIVASHSITVVTGPSGIGKSSLVKAGLLSLYPESDVLEIRPGKKPAEILVEALHKKPGIKILLVDQYEELVTICDDPQQREVFEKTLKLLSGQCKIIITIRSDLEFRFRSILELGYRFAVPAFSRDEIRMIVTQPAMQEVLEFKAKKNADGENEKFISKIVDDAYQNPGCLPLLSLALSDLYENKDNSNLLEKVYDDFGGITGILDKLATKEYKKYIYHSDQDCFRHLIFRMISFESGQIAKRKIYASLDPLLQEADDELLYADDNKTYKVRAMAQGLVDARLLRVGMDEQGREYIEPSHEALLNSWTLLLEWIKEKNEQSDMAEPARNQLHQAVAEIAVTYAQKEDSNKKASSRKRDYLWVQDPRLELARKEIGNRLNKLEETFIADSENRKKFVKTRTTVFLSSVAIILLGATAFGWIMQAQSAREAKKNRALFLASESDKYGQSEKLAMLKKAYTIYKDSSIERKIYDLLNAYDYYNPFAIAHYKTKDSIQDFHYTTDGELLVVGKEKRRGWNYLKDSSYEITGGLQIMNVDVEDDETSNIHIANQQNGKRLTLEKHELMGKYVDLQKRLIFLLTADSVNYNSICLDSNLQYVSKRSLKVPVEYTNVRYFPENGYFAVDSDYVDVLFDPSGRRLEAMENSMQVIGVFTTGKGLVKLLQKETEGEGMKVGIAQLGQMKISKWLHLPYSFSSSYTTAESFSLRDSVFLLTINNPPMEGPGGQFTKVFKCNFKNGSGHSLVETDYVFNTFRLSPDKKYAVATSETDSLYYIDVSKEKVWSYYFKNLASAEFNGADNGYHTIIQSQAGYTVSIFDSTGGEVNKFDYSGLPAKIKLSPNNQFVSILYGDSTILTWQLDPVFTSKPWGEMLNSETAYGSFVVHNVEVSNSGSFVGINADIAAGSTIPDVYYFNNDLYLNKHQTSYLLVPGTEIVLECIEDPGTANITGMNEICLENGKKTVLHTDSAMERIMNLLMNGKLSIKVEKGIVYYFAGNNNKKMIDSFTRIVQGWDSWYFKKDNALLYAHGYSDTSYTLFEDGREPGKKEGVSLHETGFAKFKNRQKFIYETEAGKIFSEQIKLIAGYDLYGKDSLAGFENNGHQVLYSESGIVVIFGGRPFIFDRNNPAVYGSINIPNVIAAALYKNGDKIILVGQDGTIYRKKTRRYLTWFLGHGYTIPFS